MKEKFPSSGWLLIDKPEGIESFGVIRKLKFRYSFNKIGFAGTLDPLASGLLLIGINKATKKIEEVIMGFLDKMKQAKDMYGNMKKIQQELDKIECSGSSSSGKIIAVVKGNHHIKSIKIDNSLKSSSSNLENLIVEAINDGHKNVDKEIKSKMGNMMNMGGMKLPF